MTVLLLLAAAPQGARELGEEQYQKGAASFRAGRLDEARAHFEEATRLAPGDPRGWKGLGVVHAARGNYRQAEDPFRKACELNPRDPDACYYLGLASYQVGRYENAVAAYRTALQSGGPVGRVRAGMGLALEALGRNDDAERELREAVKKNDGRSAPDVDPRVELGAFLSRQGRLEEALPVLEAAAKARPDSATVHFEAARILVQLDRLEAAVVHLREAVRLNASHAAAHLLLGKVYFRLGQTADAERHTQIGRNLADSANH